MQNRDLSSSSESEQHKTFNNVRQSARQPVQATRYRQDRHNSSSHSDSNDVANSDRQQHDHANNDDDNDDNNDDNDDDNDGNDDNNDDDEFPVALNGLVFSFLPAEIADKLNNVSDWK